MNQNLNSSQLPKDIYRVSKETLQFILNKYNIKYRDNDTVADLRPIVADLKAYLKDNLTEEKKFIFRKLINSKQTLTEVELIKYPGLIRIVQFIRDRENLYDNPNVDDLENEYEDVQLGIFPPDENFIQDSQTDEIINNSRILGQGTSTENSELTNTRLIPQNQLESNNPLTMSKEKLPLISAGTYHGLPSENPNEFIDKYDIAATSNHWSENSKINLFPAHLASTALAWYQHYSKGRPINSWDDLKKSFITSFTPVAQAQTLQSILENKIQGRDQPVLAYFLEVLTLCKRHNPETTDKQIIHYIIQGLRPEFCDRILNETSDTLEQLEKNLKKIELQVQIRAQNIEKYKRAENVGQHNYYSENHEQEINNLKAEIKNLTEAISNISVQNPKPENTRFPNNKQHRQDYQGQGVNFYRGAPDYTTRSRYQQQTQQTAWRQRPTTYATVHPQHRRPWNPLHNTFTPRAPAPTTPYVMYCSICKRNNHKTQDCRYRSPLGNPHRTKYCAYCRMTNHTGEECYKQNKQSTNKKNS